MSSKKGLHLYNSSTFSERERLWNLKSNAMQTGFNLTAAVEKMINNMNTWYTRKTMIYCFLPLKKTKKKKNKRLHSLSTADKISKSFFYDGIWNTDSECIHRVSFTIRGVNLSQTGIFFFYPINYVKTRFSKKKQQKQKTKHQTRKGHLKKEKK